MLSEEVTNLIGRTGETVTLEVEKGAIRKFADAVGDQNPLYWDEEYARDSRYGTIVAPPGFYGWPIKWKGSMPFFAELKQELIDTISRMGYKQVIDGGIDFDFCQPVHAGDVLASVDKIIDVSEYEGKRGKRVLSVIKTTYTNQNGDVVAKARKITIQQ